MKRQRLFPRKQKHDNSIRWRSATCPGCGETVQLNIHAVNQMNFYNAQPPYCKACMRKEWKNG